MTDQFQEEAAKLDLKNIVIGSIVGALGFLVALSWRDTIQRTIDLFVPKGEGVFFSLASSVLITVFAVIMAYALIKISQKSFKKIFKPIKRVER